MFFDGLVLVLIQMLTVLSTQIGTDEAAKYIGATTLFWSKIIVGELAACFLAIKMFRSTQFAEHQQRKNGNKNGGNNSSATATTVPPTTTK